MTHLRVMRLFLYASLSRTLVRPYFSAFYLIQSLNCVSKPYKLNLLSFWRIALIILHRFKQTTFAIGFQITGVQRWFMNRKRMFNRNVRKYNWQTTKKIGGPTAHLVLYYFRKMYFPSTHSILGIVLTSSSTSSSLITDLQAVLLMALAISLILAGTLK